MNENNNDYENNNNDYENNNNDYDSVEYIFDDDYISDEPMIQILRAIKSNNGLEVNRLCKKYKDIELAKKRHKDITLVAIACNLMAHDALNALLNHKAPINKNQINLNKIISNCNIKAEMILITLINHGLFINQEEKQALSKLCTNNHTINMLMLS